MCACVIVCVCVVCACVIPVHGDHSTAHEKALGPSETAENGLSHLYLETNAEKKGHMDRCMCLLRGGKGLVICQRGRWQTE